MWQAARCKSTGRGAGKTNTVCPLLPACFPSFALSLGWRAEDREQSSRRDRQRPGSDKQHSQLLLGAAFPPCGPSGPEDADDSPRVLRQEAAARNLVHSKGFSQSCVLFPQLSAGGRKEILNSK